MSVLFCNFTGVYINEDITSEGTLLDLSDLSGTKMYIDEGAEVEIRKRTDGLICAKDEVAVKSSDEDCNMICRHTGSLGYRLRFLDNGNYHYMTRILASYVDEPFDLITFDHHSDDQSPAFGGIKSCGSWRRDITAENHRLESSMLVQRYDEFDAVYTPSELPLYISIDKDILSDKVLTTNWDQGDMTLEQLFELLDRLIREREIIAVDVCGEDLPENPYEKNKEFNKAMMQYIYR